MPNCLAMFATVHRPIQVVGYPHRQVHRDLGTVRTERHCRCLWPTSSGIGFRSYCVEMQTRPDQGQWVVPSIS